MILFLGNWAIGVAGENCDETCHSEGLICKDRITHRQNSEVDSSDKLIALIQNLQGPGPSQTCIESSDEGAPYITRSPGAQDWCMHSKKQKEMISRCSFKLTGQSEMRQRLCYCFYPPCKHRMIN